MDTRLPFGGKRSPEIFNRLTQAVRRIMAKKGFNAVVVYLDDFLVIGETKEAAFDALLNLLQNLGFKISWSKVQGSASHFLRCVARYSSVYHVIA